MTNINDWLDTWTGDCCSGESGGEGESFFKGSLTIINKTQNDIRIYNVTNNGTFESGTVLKNNGSKTIPAPLDSYGHLRVLFIIEDQFSLVNTYTYTMGANEVFILSDMENGSYSAYVMDTVDATSTLTITGGK